METLSVTFENLLSAQKYTVNVVATTSLTMASNKTGNVTTQFLSNPSIVEVHSLPTPPGKLNVVSIDFNAVDLTWSEPKIAENAQLTEYAIKYEQLDRTGRNKILGTEKTHTALKNNHTKICGLVQGTTYGFRVKI